MDILRKIDGDRLRLHLVQTGCESDNLFRQMRRTQAKNKLVCGMCNEIEEQLVAKGLMQPMAQRNNG